MYQKFAISLRNDRRVTATIVRTYFDGLACGEALMRGKRSVPLNSDDAEDESLAVYEYVYSANCRTRKTMVFQDIKLTGTCASNF